MFRPNFPRGECEQVTCVPKYIQSWQEKIRAALLPPFVSPQRPLIGADQSTIHRHELSWGSCAVVGSSASLLGAGQGHEIDRAHTVIRINQAPLAGFETDVGSRTSVRIWGTNPSVRAITALDNVGRADSRSEVQTVETGVAQVLFCQPTPFMTKCFMLLATDSYPAYPRLAPHLWHALRVHIRNVTLS